MKSTIIGLLICVAIAGCIAGEEGIAEAVNEVTDSISSGNTDNGDFLSRIDSFQAELNHYYADSSSTPLLPEDWATFEALDFFDIDSDFNVVADFTRIVSEPFGMQTSTDRKPIYEKYGEATFTLKGVECKLSLFESHSSREDSVWKHYLFLPYKDFTSGNKSYGGGRFIDVLMPKDGKVHIDFNTSYNPLCAYNHKYSCPIPPEENYLEVEILAGVKAWEEH